jgi:hypothetical protein
LRPFASCFRHYEHLWTIYDLGHTPIWTTGMSANNTLDFAGFISITSVSIFFHYCRPNILWVTINWCSACNLRNYISTIWKYGKKFRDLSVGHVYIYNLIINLFAILCSRATRVMCVRILVPNTFKYVAKTAKDLVDPSMRSFHHNGFY